MLGCVDFNVYLCTCVICACWVMSASIHVCDMRLCVIHSRVCVGSAQSPHSLPRVLIKNVTDPSLHSSACNTAVM